MNFTFYERDQNADIKLIGSVWVADDLSRFDTKGNKELEFLLTGAKIHGEPFDPKNKEHWDALPEVFSGILLWCNKDQEITLKQKPVGIAKKQQNSIIKIILKGEGPGHPFRGNQNTDFQGRSIKLDRVLMGGNLTAEEASIFDKVEESGSRFRGKDVDKNALESLKVAGLVRPLSKGARSYDQYYQLTVKGQEVRDQLRRVRDHIAKAKLDESEAARGRDAKGVIRASQEALWNKPVTAAERKALLNVKITGADRKAL